MGRAATEFHGRERELRAILDFGNGRGARQVLVEGPAGIGKTALVSQAVQSAVSSGWATATGLAEELESGRPFGVLADALGCWATVTDPGRRQVAELLAPRTITSAPSLEFQPETRFLVQEAILAVIAEQIERGPFLLVVEDLHWADPASLATLLAAVRRHTQEPFDVIATMRRTPRSAELDRFVGQVSDSGALALELEPLSRDAIARIVIDQTGGHPGPALARYLDGADGNPFIVLELLRTLQDEGALDPLGEMIELRPGSGLPTSARQSLIRRIGAMTATERSFLRAGCVLGASFELADVTQLAGLEIGEGIDAVTAGIEHGLLVEDGYRLRFRHELIRRALYDEMPAVVQRTMHRRAATQLAAAADPDPVRIAAQLVESAEPGDDLALTWLERAALVVAPRDPAGAVDLFERALALGPPTAQRGRMLADLVGALSWAGRLAEAEERAVNGLAADPDPEVARRLRRGLALSLFLQGRGSDAAEVWEADLATVGDDLTAYHRTLGEAATSRLWAGELDVANRHATAIVESGCVDPAALTMARCVRSRVAAMQGRLREAVAEAEAAVGGAQGSDEALRRAPHVYLSLAYIHADRPLDAIRINGEGLRRCETLGASGIVPLFRQSSIVSLFFGGFWDDARAEVESIAGNSEERMSIQTRAIMGIIELHSGDIDAASEAAKWCWSELADGASNVGSLFVVWLEALLAEHRGDYQGGATWLATAVDEMENRGTPGLMGTVTADLVRLLLASDQPDPARAVTARFETVAEHNGTAVAAAVARRCRAMVDNDVDSACAAVEILRLGIRPLDHVLACELAGSLCAAAGDVARAAAMLEEGLVSAEQLGAIVAHRRMTARVRSLGVKPGVRGRRSRPVSGWESLTRSEAQVTELVAAGLSNPEIAERLYVSRRTVETHVSNTLRKLSLTGRGALAAAYRNR